MSNQPGIEYPEIPPESENRPATPKPVLTNADKLRRFLIGFLGWWLVNVPLWLLLDRVSGAVAFMIPVFIVQVIVLIIMAFVNRWVALGLVAAIALNFIISIFLGLFLNMLCWIPFTSPNPLF